MNPLPPVDAVPLFPDERRALLDLLRSLTPEQWAAPTVCPGWSAKDIAAHLVADDFGRLGWQRDGHSGNRFEPSSPEKFEEDLAEFINRQNNLWVEASRRLSPRVIIDLLEWTGRETQTLFEALDPDAPGLGVSWAGENVSPNWFDLAREYTERWHHQAQIREAVGAPLLYETEIYHPVLATFVRGVPYALRRLDAPDGTHIRLAVTESGPSEWSIVRESDHWKLGFVPGPSSATGGFGTLSVSIGEPAPGDKVPQPEAHLDYDAFVVLHPDMAWRVFTRNMSFDEANKRALKIGDERLCEAVLRTFCLVA